MVRWPGTVPAGVVDKTTELATVDLLPTFLDLAGANLPENYQADGVSIASAIRGEAFDRQKPIYWDWRFSNDRPDFWPSAAVQEGNWKLLTNDKLGRAELYNIANDWAEQKDLAAENPEKLKELTYKLQAIQETLPVAPPENSFSKERETLKLAN